VSWHTAKYFLFKKIENFAECLPILALDKPAVTVFFPSSDLFFAKGRVWHSSKLCRVPDIKLSTKGGFAVRNFVMRALPWVAVGKTSKDAQKAWLNCDTRQASQHKLSAYTDT
jgi:hypothetical protein